MSPSSISSLMRSAILSRSGPRPVTRHPFVAWLMTATSRPDYMGRRTGTRGWRWMQPNRIRHRFCKHSATQLLGWRRASPGHLGKRAADFRWKLAQSCVSLWTCGSCWVWIGRLISLSRGAELNSYSIRTCSRVT